MIPTDVELHAARAKLSQLDPLMAKAHAEVRPSTWVVRERGFRGLVRQIVGQQVSMAAADAIRRKMIDGLGTLSPETVLSADDAQLRGFGLSSQKIRYVRAIAEAADLFERLDSMSDEEAVAALVAIKGVGRWTAETYLMFSEGRLDFFPAGDIALQQGFRLLEGSESRPTEKALYARAEIWKPYRGIAALLLWGYYMQARGRATESGAVLSP
ncbi:DNA-3-methyladenine glycosylase 2 family protein [Methylocystis sp. IM3]|uniref:DNA-3-methyladenine glycosylase family protein n=1 Tax=Methylocystis sp. IM3 TaxID=3136722 RepID=UPI00311A3E30